MAVESANYISELVEAYPAGTEGVAEGDDHLRTVKKVLKQTFPGRSKPEDAYAELAGASVSFVASQIGQLLVPLSATSIALPKLGTDYEGYTFKFIPGVDGTLAGVGGDTVNGAASLVYEAGGVYFASGASGSTWKVYRAGGGAASFPSGTRMPFAQASAPVGWTQDVSENANNRMLRVVNTAGNGVGGSHSPILNNVVPAHTHVMTTGTESADHTHSGNTGGMSADHTHAIGDPGHQHNITPYNAYNLAGGGSTSLAAIGGGVMTSVGYTGIWTGTSSAGHYHGFTSGGRSAAHTHTGTTDNGSSQTNWTPKYIDMIIAARN